MVSRAVFGWFDFKSFVEHASAISNDAVHVLVGGLGTLLIAVVTRRSVADWLPWLTILSVAVANESADLWREQWPSPAMQYGEGAKDILLTMALPTALLIVARCYPRIFSRTP